MSNPNTFVLRDDLCKRNVTIEIPDENDWHPVTESPPSGGVYCLIETEAGELEISKYLTGDFMYNGTYTAIEDKVRRWMLLYDVKKKKFDYDKR